VLILERFSASGGTPETLYETAIVNVCTTE